MREHNRSYSSLKTKKEKMKNWINIHPPQRFMIKGKVPDIKTLFRLDSASFYSASFPVSVVKKVVCRIEFTLTVNDEVKIFWVEASDPLRAVVDALKYFGLVEVFFYSTGIEVDEEASFVGIRFRGLNHWGKGIDDDPNQAAVQAVFLAMNHIAVSLEEINRPRVMR